MEKYIRVVRKISNDLVKLNLAYSSLEEITEKGLLIYVVEDRIEGDHTSVSEEDRLAILEESKRTNLQLAFNELRAKYKFDEKISVSNQFANQSL